MKIYNEDKTIEITEVDFEKGYLKSDKLFVAHHEAIPFKKGRTAQEIAEELKEQDIRVEKGVDDNLYTVITEYEGGADVEIIEDELDTPAVEAYDEYEDIQVFVPYTEEELTARTEKKRHKELKTELAKIKEDIEQETFGLVRDDYTEKKARAAEIINKLRVLEGKEPRKIKEE